MEKTQKIREYLDISPFNPVVYESESSSKILVIIQRLSRIIRKLIWDKVKDYGLTATQGEILMHILFNSEERRKVSVISEEFGISKPTVSRAINIIIDKGFIEKRVDENERRSHILSLTPKGLEIAAKISLFGNVLADIIRVEFNEQERRKVLIALLNLTEKLVENGISHEFPSCIFCRYFEAEGESFWCDKLQMVIIPETIRLNCDIFQSREKKKKPKRARRE
ncbi:MAG: MarR family winged helix-turn-helix transcriptional regulator [Candidatus Calescibacterium sp.]|nr:MarR family winged helix-turn-helix transcriptional regulator [Candidatus Calescibacterium sp.]MCX7733742.1 MarR family winged helix-turn-helix transcriptional regulator [bacterium]MDW8086694.1 MarR family winged helix-turn-helix transcriptional regulator [Candidatus Calescibacterium sp.]